VQAHGLADGEGAGRQLTDHLQERLDPSVVVDELYGNRQAGEGVREPQRPDAP
jgi:hypothetical protein